MTSKYIKIHSETKILSDVNSDNILIVWKDDFFLSEAKKDFENFETINLKLSNEKKFIENILTLNPRLIISDDESIIKKVKKHFDTILYKKIKNNFENIIVSNDAFFNKYEDLFTKYENNIYIKNNCESNFYNYLKQNKKSNSKIIWFSKNEIIASFKLNGKWFIYENNDLKKIFEISKNKKIDFKKLTSFSKNENPFKNEFMNEDYIASKQFDDLIKWIVSNDFIIDCINIKNKKHFFIDEKIEIKLNDKSKFEGFKEKLINNLEMKDFPIISSTIDEDLIAIKVKNGFFYINKSDDTSLEIKCELFTDELSDYELNKLKDNLFFNLKSNILEEKNSIKKNKISQTIKTLIGLLTFLIIFTITFTIIFDVENMRFLFLSIGNINSWNAPWMYLIIIFFCMSFFMPVLVAYILEKIILKKDKIDKRMIMNYFFASLIRNSITFLTGNFFLSTFAWGWYLNKNTEIKTIELVSFLSLASLFRGIAIAMIGFVFMFSGTLSYFLYFNGSSSASSLTIIIMSWFGFAWNLIHNFWIYFLIASPIIVSFFLEFNLWFNFKNKNYNKKMINDIFYKNQMYTKSRISLSWNENKEIIFRSLLLVSIPIITEGIETLCYFNYVDHVILSNAGLSSEFELYTNIISIPALRYLVSQLHHFPIINILPGKGMGFTEFGLSSLYSSIFTNHHHGISSNWNGYSSEDLAQITSFITRFFNVYLYISIAIVTSIFTVFRAISKRRMD